MRAKKVLVLVLFLSAILLLAGCGATSTETGDKAVGIQSGNEDLLYAEYRDADGNFDFKGETLQLMWNIAPDYHAAWARIKNFEEDCNAKVEVVTAGWGDSPAKLASSVASGDPADVTYVYATWYPDYMVANFLEPIDQYIPLMESLASDDDENYFSYDETKFFQWNGDRYLFTNNNAPTHALFFYNKTMFDEMGLEYPDELEKNGEWTHEKLMEYAEILTMDKDGNGVVDQFGMEDRDFVTMLLTSNDTDLLQLGREDGEETKLTLRDPATMHALTVYETMKGVDNSIGGEVALGTAAMGFRAWWVKDDLTDSLGLDGWGFASAPRGPHNEAGVGAGIHTEGWGIIKGSKNPVMSTVFLQYYLNSASGVIEDNEDEPPFEGFKSQEDYDRYLSYMKNLRKEQSHVLETDFVTKIGTKPLASLIEEYEPQLQGKLDKLLAHAGIVMAGDGEPFEAVSYEFETDIAPFVSNVATTTNAMIEHSTDNQGAVNIKTDILAVWDLYATTDPELLVFEPGHKYKVSFDYTLNEAVGEDGRYYLVFVVDGKTLSDTHYGFDATVGEKNSYEVEFDFYDNIEGGHLKFGGFSTSDILIENLKVETLQ